MQLAALFLLLTGYWVSGAGWVRTGDEVHDFHLSRSEINYDTPSSTLQVTVHIFVDDLEKILAKGGKKNLRLGRDNEAAEADQAIADYLSQHQVLSGGGKVLKPSFIGKEPSEDFIAFYCYLEYEVPAGIKEVIIKNNILTELYDDQKNMVQVTKNKKRVSSFLFDKEQYSDVVRF